MTEFKHYRKVTQTEARILNESDMVARKGVIETLEGPRTFQVGDYLAHDAKGEWPIRKEKIEQDYQRVSEPDVNGFAHYQPQDIREACQMQEAFTIGSLTGKPGDYLVRSNGRQWPVDREIFESAYKLVDCDEHIETVADLFAFLSVPKNRKGVWWNEDEGIVRFWIDKPDDDDDYRVLFSMSESEFVESFFAQFHLKRDRVADEA